LTLLEAFGLAIGLIFILEGLGYALAPAFMRRMMTQIWEMSEQNLRFMGFVAVIVGLVVILFISG
jgi:uncharacterized protein YjeT (DUF2065 family)